MFRTTEPAERRKSAPTGHLGPSFKSVSSSGRRTRRFVPKREQATIARRSNPWEAPTFLGGEPKPRRPGDCLACRRGRNRVTLMRCARRPGLSTHCFHEATPPERRSWEWASQGLTPSRRAFSQPTTGLAFICALPTGPPVLSDQPLDAAAEIGALHPLVGRQVSRESFQHDSAAFHDIAIIGDFQRGAGILLDQQDRRSLSPDARDQIRRSAAPPAAPGRATARRGAAVCGFAISARPMHSICCSPPLSDPAFWRSRPAERRKHREHVVELRRNVPGRQGYGAQHEVFPHAHRPEDHPAFGRLHQPEADDPVRLQVGDRRAREDDASLQRSDKLPEMARISDVLPTPLLPMTATTAPLRHFQSYAPQDLLRAHADADLLDAKNGHRRASLPAPR